jgi:hypothetical protein
VFIDDFVGTGRSASGYLQDLEGTLANIIRERGIKVVFVAMVAFLDGWKLVEKTVESLSMSVHTHVCEVLDDTAKCFSEHSRIFIDRNQKELAKGLAFKYGKILEKECPLGYGNLEMTIVFEGSCPNNSLPILWSDSAKPKWVPLFKRH